MQQLTTTIEGKCNLDCGFCYHKKSTEEKTLEQIKEEVDNYAVKKVNISGGEPLLHPKINEILESISEGLERIIISTNGTIIPKGFLELDKTLREKTEIQISLPAGTRKTYQQITGKDLFERVKENIPKIKSSYETVLTATIYNSNIRDISNIVKVAEEENLPLRVNLAFPIGEAKNIELINRKELDKLKGYLLVKNLENPNIDSTIIHSNNCPVLEQIYGIKQTSVCPVDIMTKTFTDINGKKSLCEFYR